jgi:hypothetical protein
MKVEDKLKQVTESIEELHDPCAISDIEIVERITSDENINL